MQKQNTNRVLFAPLKGMGKCQKGFLRHLSDGGNSGVFLWSPLEVLESIKPGQLPPGGIEVQVLDHGFTAKYETSSGKKADWFTTDGDVFPVGSSTMKPFQPTAPDGGRSFP